VLVVVINSGWSEPTENGDIRSFDSLQELLDANYTLIHCGYCGECSNWKDLSKQWTTRTYLSEITKKWYVLYSLLFFVTSFFYLLFPHPLLACTFAAPKSPSLAAVLKTSNSVTWKSLLDLRKDVHSGKKCLCLLFCIFDALLNFLLYVQSLVISWTVDELCAKSNCFWIFLQSTLINAVSDYRVQLNDITSATCKPNYALMLAKLCVVQEHESKQH
jgi:hypothetical protein